MTNTQTSVTADNAERQRRTIKRTAIFLAVLAFSLYLGFMALRLL